MKKLRHNTRLLAALMALLFTGLIGYFSYSVYFYGGRWFANANNPRLADQKQHVIAGDILDRKGEVLATTVDAKRTYPKYTDMRLAVSHVVGDSQGIVANGAETFLSSYLLGFRSGIWERVAQLIGGQPARGDDVTLTIDAQLCEYAANFLKGYRGGAVVVLNWKTGEILCSTSYPDFDPRNVAATMNDAKDNGAFVNRATQGQYPPGSTFKIITMAAALQNLPGSGDYVFDCTGLFPVERTIVTEASGQVHGEGDMEQAFAKSCNTAFAAMALELGYGRMAQTAAAFGFGDNFLFKDLVVFNSQYPVSQQSKDDLAWSGIGQGRVLTSPLHMAMVAAAIANDGVMMEPRLLLSATTAQGTPRALPPARTYRRACTPIAAQTLKQYMIATVTSGTATRAKISGLTVAGKTGSAETSDDKTVKTHAWFVGFIDSDEHPLAIAVLVERGGGGSTIATPIAQQVLSRAVKLGY